MTTLLDLSTLNKDNLIKKQTEHKFCEQLHAYFDEFPFLYDICKDILTNKPTQNYLIYELDYNWLFTVINDDHLTFTYAYRRLNPHEICFISIDLYYNSGKFTFKNLSTEIDFAKLPFETTRFERISTLHVYYDPDILWTGDAKIKHSKKGYSFTTPKEFCRNIHQAICSPK